MTDPEEVDWVDQARRATAFIAWLYRLQERARREREVLEDAPMKPETEQVLQPGDQVLFPKPPSQYPDEDDERWEPAVVVRTMTMPGGPLMAICEFPRWGQRSRWTRATALKRVGEGNGGSTSEQEIEVSPKAGRAA